MGEAAPSAPTISIRGLTKRFGDKVVLEGLDLDVEKGRSLVIIGGSGTGKSVLLKCLLGLLRPDAGAIRIDGALVAAGDAASRGIGMLFQSAALFDSLSVWRNVAFRLIHAERVPTVAARGRAIDCLAAVGLDPPIADLYPPELSGGMQKRVALARAIAASPRILFFDEPTTGLDPINAGIINRLIVERVGALGATAISITHDLVSARRIADEIALLHEGRIVWRGPSGALDTSGHPQVDAFVRGQA